MKKMNPEIKTEWIAALRSGLYKQGTKKLNRDEQYCCLGVLCEIAVKHGITTSSHAYAPVAGATGVIQYGMNQTAGLPLEVCEWSGVTAYGLLPPNTIIESGKKVTDLAFMNDSGYSFEEIAIMIEKVL